VKFLVLRRLIRALWPRRPVVVYARVTEAITSPIPDEHGIVTSAAGKRCFLCGEALSDPAWAFSGFPPDLDDEVGSGFIFLHLPACARSFRDKLSRDIDQAEGTAPQDPA